MHRPKQNPFSGARAGVGDKLKNQGGGINYGRDPRRDDHLAINDRVGRFAAVARRHMPKEDRKAEIMERRLQRPVDNDDVKRAEPKRAEDTANLLNDVLKEDK